MWSWLLKLMQFFRGEEEDEQGNPQTQARASQPVYSSSQLQAKTKNIYPRERESTYTPRSSREKERQFRFPVIPDKPREKRKMPEQEHRERTPVTPPERRIIKPEQPEKRLYPSTPEKRSYTPTEVVSPVYGRMKPAERKQRAADEQQEKTAEERSFAETLPDLSKKLPEPNWTKLLLAMDRAEEQKAAKVARPLPDETEQAAFAKKEEVRSELWKQVEETAVSAHQPENGIGLQEAVSAPEYAGWSPAPLTDCFSHSDDGQLEASRVAEESILPVEMIEERQADEAAHPPAVQAAIPTGDSQYTYPTLALLNPSPQKAQDDDEHTQIQRLLLEDTLSNFNVSAQVIGIVKGPSVTRFELQPAPGVKVNKITGLVDDIKLNLAAKDIRIEAPIPGRNAVGIEVPNLKSEPIFIRRIIESEQFRSHPSPLAIALGMDIGGEPIVSDIKKMPHGLIAGSTGSGKSVCINSIIISLLYKATPEQVRLLLIDPKMVELAPYNHLPHLVTPVVTDPKQATFALKWAVEEMERRYTLFADAGARDIERYNVTTDDPLPYIVIIIDELADLMMVSPQDVEDSIIRIAQKARACGIHLLLATQRPSVDVITGNIKANVPSRLAFAVFSQVDSRTILDQSGAERLLGRGDMLFLESGAAPLRLQGNYVSDDEIERITQMIKKQRKPEYLFSKEDLEHSVQSYDMGDDPLYLEALIHVAEQGQASASALQRRFRIGYNRAARLIDMMEAEGHVSGQSGGKGRTVLITREDAQALMDGSTLV